VQPESSVIHDVGKGSPLDVLHHDEATLLSIFYLIDGTNIRMVEAGGGSGFSKQALSRLLYHQRSFAEDLDRDLSVKIEIVSKVNLAHSTSSNSRTISYRPSLSSGARSFGDAQTYPRRCYRTVFHKAADFS